MSSKPKWLEIALLDEGLRETPSKNTSHPRIDAMYRTSGHGWAVGEDSEVAWCAAAMNQWLFEADYPYLKGKGALGAISFERYGSRLNTMGSIPPGAICVFYRTSKRQRDWRRHVAIAVKSNSTYVWCIGGNQSNAVNIRRFNRADLSAVRWPVANDKTELKEAGSTEIAETDAIKTGTIITGTGTAVGAAITERTTPSELAETAEKVTDQIGIFHSFGLAIGKIGSFLVDHWWIALVAVVLIAVYLAANRLQKRRLERHAEGDPISTQYDEADWHVVPDDIAELQGDVGGWPPEDKDGEVDPDRV